MTIFEAIKHIDEFGNEYWLARELQVVLEYKLWQNFNNVIMEAIINCKNSHHNVFDHFIEVNKMVDIGSKTKRRIQDYKLSRYACYLIVQNGDPRKEIIALGKTYFAIQTRKQELLERDYNLLSEDDKRFYQRILTKKGNYNLNYTAMKCGVKDFARFHNFGYKGLYNGETADDIFKRKGLRYREDILDNMGSEELAANLFRITQTNQELKNSNIKGEKKASKTHYNVGKDVRKFMKKHGKRMPEEFETPKHSLKELDKEFYK